MQWKETVMIDIKLIRANPDKYIEAAKAKRMDVDIAELVKIDSQLAKTQQEIQTCRALQNAAGKDIAKLKDPAAKQEAIGKMSSIKARIKELEEWVEKLQPRFDELMLLVP